MSSTKHITITNNIKEKIKPLSIVLPSHYAKLYVEEANAFEINLDPEELLNSDMLSEKVVHHVITLASCTQKAIEAIELEDKKALVTILLETKALRNEIDELRKIVYEDSLTKAYNRKWFQDHYLYKESNTLNQDGILVMIDLNKFKKVNDTYGHIIGDKVLSHIAKKFKNLGENIIRYGGDEFLIVLESSASIEKFKINIENILLKLQTTSFQVAHGSFKISFSYGYSSFKKGSALENCLDEADKEMYKHKRKNHDNSL